MFRKLKGNVTSIIFLQKPKVMQVIGVARKRLMCVGISPTYF